MGRADGDRALRAGAATRALECDRGTPYGRGEGVYDDGLAKVQESAEAALDDFHTLRGLRRRRDTRGELAGLLRTTYDNVASIPEGATDSGLRRDGRQLWIGPDEEAAYLVRLDDAQDLERWPAAKRPIRCA